MRIQISKDLNQKEIEKQIKHAEIVEDGDYILISKNNRVNVLDSEGIVFININDINYIEVIDNTLYVYTDTNKYISMIKLYEYLDLSFDLIRINKSTIINKHKIEEIRPSINMKFNVLIKDVWHVVNRTYYYDFKEILNI